MINHQLIVQIQGTLTNVTNKDLNYKWLDFHFILVIERNTILAPSDLKHYWTLRVLFSDSKPSDYEGPEVASYYLAIGGLCKVNFV